MQLISWRDDNAVTITNVYTPRRCCGYQSNAAQKEKEQADPIGQDRLDKFEVKIGAMQVRYLSPPVL